MQPLLMSSKYKLPEARALICVEALMRQDIFTEEVFAEMDVHVLKDVLSRHTSLTEALRVIVLKIHRDLCAQHHHQNQQQQQQQQVLPASIVADNNEAQYLRDQI